MDWEKTKTIRDNLVFIVMALGRTPHHLQVPAVQAVLNGSRQITRLLAMITHRQVLADHRHQVVQATDLSIQLLILKDIQTAMYIPGKPEDQP
jgi:hypothetical protein